MRKSGFIVDPPSRRRGGSRATKLHGIDGRSKARTRLPKEGTAGSISHRLASRHDGDVDLGPVERTAALCEGGVGSRPGDRSARGLDASCIRAPPLRRRAGANTPTNHEASGRSGSRRRETPDPSSRPRAQARETEREPRARVQEKHDWWWQRLVGRIVDVALSGATRSARRLA